MCGFPIRSDDLKCRLFAHDEAGPLCVQGWSAATDARSSESEVQCLHLARRHRHSRPATPSDANSNARI